MLQNVSCDTCVVGGVMIAVHFMEKRRCECLCADMVCKLMLCDHVVMYLILLRVGQFISVEEMHLFLVAL